MTAEPLTMTNTQAARPSGADWPGPLILLALLAAGYAAGLAPLFDTLKPSPRTGPALAAYISDNICCWRCCIFMLDLYGCCGCFISRGLHPDHSGGPVVRLAVGGRSSDSRRHAWVPQSCFRLRKVPSAMCWRKKPALSSAASAPALREDAFNYLLFLRLVPAFPFWLVNIAPALGQCEAAHLRHRHLPWHHPRHLCLCLRGCRARQHHHRAASRAMRSVSPQKALRECPFELSLSSLITTATAAGLCRTWRRGTHSRRAEEMESPPCNLISPSSARALPGLSVAAAAAQFGEKVVLFEKGEMGGDCLNTGCVPSKALLAAAKAAQAHRSSAPFGVAPDEPDVDFAKVMAHVESVIATIAPLDSQERFEGLGVKVVRAAVRFTGPQHAGSQTARPITARRIVIATGSRAGVPPIPGINDVPFFTNETIFKNRDLPKHLIIIGGGPIGMEMALAHRRLGAEVTVLEAFQPLAKDDPELTKVVLDRLAGRRHRHSRRHQN